MIVDCAHYQDGSRQHAGTLSLDEAVECCRGDGFVWLGLHDPSPEELTHVGERFGLHELALEDARNSHQRPKIEDYEQGLFVVLHTARYLDDVEEVEFSEVHVFLGASYAVTVRHGEASRLHGARERLEERHDLLREGPYAVAWAVMDQIVDDYRPVMDGLENDVEEVEEAVFSERPSDQSRRVYFLRRELADFYRAVHPLRDPLEAAEHGRWDVPPILRDHLRDVSDHLKRIDGDILTQRDLLSSILQANLAVIGVQQNEVVRKISGWAAIITVPTFISSVYGMNFQHMPELEWQYGYPLVLAFMVAIAAVLRSILRRAGWI